MAGKSILFFCLTSGVVLFAAGLFLFLWIPRFIDNKILEELPLVNGSNSFKKWSEKMSEMPIIAKFYLFHVENVEDVLMGMNPILTEKGPYTFKEVRSRQVFGWNEDETLIRYKVFKHFYYNPSPSDANINENVTVGNLPLHIAVKKLSSLKEFGAYFQQTLFSNFMSASKEYSLVSKSAKELLISGYNVSSIEKSNALSRKNVPYNFAFVRKLNNSNEGLLSVYSGKDNMDKFLQIVRWNNQSQTDCWEGPACRAIEGTDGTQFAPAIKPNSNHKIFLSSLHRSSQIEYEGPHETRGITTYRFKVSDSLFAAPLNSSNVKSTDCYCTSEEEVIDYNRPPDEKLMWKIPSKEEERNQEQWREEDYCSADGLIDLSTCSQTLVVLSKPHFLGVSPGVAKRVHGLNPNEERHSSFIDIDPLTGVVLKGARKIQFNYKVQRDSGFNGFQQLKPLIMPLFWMEELVEADDNLANDIKGLVHNKLRAAKAVAVGLLVVGSVLILCTSFLLLKKTCVNGKDGEKSANGIETEKFTFKGLSKSEKQAISENSQAMLPAT